MVNVFKKGYKADPGSYRGITFCKILNDRVETNDGEDAFYDRGSTCMSAKKSFLNDGVR